MTRSKIRSDRPETSTSVVRVRGVPWNCTQEDLKKFFDNLEIEEAHFDVTPSGRLTGDAYVKFTSSSSADEAVKHDRQVRTRLGEALLGSVAQQTQWRKCLPTPLGGCPSQQLGSVTLAVLYSSQDEMNAVVERIKAARTRCAQRPTGAENACAT